MSLLSRVEGSSLWVSLERQMPERGPEWSRVLADYRGGLPVSAPGKPGPLKNMGC